MVLLVRAALYVCPVSPLMCIIALKKCSLLNAYPIVNFQGPDILLLGPAVATSLQS